MKAPEKTQRGEQTKELIVTSAVELFREQGYEKTTMRSIARKAGVSTGNAYYYFPSKDHLVQEFYSNIQEEHLAAANNVLRRKKGLAARAQGVLHALVDVMTPYHAFAGNFIKNALEPGSPVSPFSEESAPARARSLAIWERVVTESDTKMGKELRSDLPELLWLAQMGVTLYWVHDTSPAQGKTRKLIDSTIPLLERAIGMSRLPIVSGMTSDMLALLKELKL